MNKNKILNKSKVTQDTHIAKKIVKKNLDIFGQVSYFKF